MDTLDDAIAALIRANQEHRELEKILDSVERNFDRHRAARCEAVERAIRVKKRAYYQALDRLVEMTSAEKTP